MIETQSNSQKSEKIAALSKILENHEYALQENQKQLQAINIFMQRLAEAEEKHQQSPNQGSRALIANNLGAQEPSMVNPIKNLKLKFPCFQGEDLTCWMFRANQFFSYHNTLEHQRVIMASYHLDGEALIWF